MSKPGSFKLLRNAGSDRSRRIREEGFQALLADSLRFGEKLPSGSATQSSSSESSASASTSAFRSQLLLRSRTGDGWPEAGSKKTISSVDTRRSLSEGGGRLSSGGPPAVDAVPYGEEAVGPRLGGSLTTSAFVAFVDIVDIEDTEAVPMMSGVVDGFPDEAKGAFPADHSSEQQQQGRLHRLR